MYTYAEKMIQLYDCLQDELSKKIFWARLQYETEPNLDLAVQLSMAGSGKREQGMTWRDRFTAAAAAGKKIVLYGAGERGIAIAERLWRSHENFYAFCDRKKSGQTVLGKPVLSPQELINSPEQYTVLITTDVFYEEIARFLQECGFPMTSVFSLGDASNKAEQYYEFPELFRPGTAIVDAGCYDGADTIRFSKWCRGAYSKIYAFEPDADNYFLGKTNIEANRIPNVELLQAGLSKTSGKGSFAGSLRCSSHLTETKTGKFNCPLAEAENATVQVYALDDVVDVEIGLIKMDIEGAEFDALHGAERTILRDKPLMAICVYHRRGDMLAIMEYLHGLVPEYRFWLRHYASLDNETVLYAAV